MTEIVRDEGIRSGDPHIAGTRITVTDVKRRVIDIGADPHVVAGEYGLSMAELFGALTYYYEHRDAFEEGERDAAARRRDGEQRTRALLDGHHRDGARSSERAD